VFNNKNKTSAFNSYDSSPVNYTLDAHHKSDFLQQSEPNQRQRTPNILIEGKFIIDMKKSSERFKRINFSELQQDKSYCSSVRREGPSALKNKAIHFAVS